MGVFSESDHVATNRNVLNTDHISFVSGVPQEWASFDWDELERRMGEAEPDPGPNDAAEEFGELFRYCWQEPGNLKLARRRFRRVSKFAGRSGADPAAVAFLRLVNWCCNVNRPGYEATPFLRFVTISATVNPGLVAGKTFADIGRELGIRKATISKISRNFRQAFGFFHHEFRCAAGREHMRAARLRQRAPGAAKALPRNRKAPASDCQPGP
jgi:hypothetical protein